MLFSVWLKFNDAQKQIGLTEFKYLCFTFLSGDWVSSFKNTGDFVIRALCSDHVIGTFRCKQNGRVKKNLHTHVLLAYPTLKNVTPKSISLFNVVSKQSRVI